VQCEYPRRALVRVAARGYDAHVIGSAFIRRSARRRFGGRRWRRRVSRERLRWAVRIRALVIALFLAVALAARAAGVPWSLAPLLVVAFLGAVMDAVAAVCVHRWRGIGAMILWTAAGDAVLITTVARATGGAHSPFLFLYAVQVVTTAIVLGARMAALGGGLGLVLLAGAVLRSGALTTPGGGAEPDRVVWILSLTLTLMFLGFIGGHLTRRLARTERELAGAHGRLARSLRRLARAHGELQEAYTKLARAESQLVSAEKMRAFGVLVAGVAHELGNPLTVLAGNLEPLQEALAAYETIAATRDAVPATSPQGAADGARQDATDTRARTGSPGAPEEWRLEAPLLIGSCREATERAVALLVKLRSFGRRADATELALAPLRPGLESTLALVRHRLPPRVRIAACYGEVPDVMCDPVEINQVFMNLLLNAADALRPGGTLTVSLAHDGDAVTVTIADDGPGIDPVDLPHVFEPFFTTKDVGQGSGLGLAISQAIVARHGGRLVARTAAGGGAELVLALPIPRSAPEVGRGTNVEQVAQRVAQEVEGEHGQHDRQPGEDRQVRRDEDEGAAVVQHHAP
jgi:signal transduction histidine kinase